MEPAIPIPTLTDSEQAIVVLLAVSIEIGAQVKKWLRQKPPLALK